MPLTVLVACIVVICAAVVIWIKYSKSRARRQLEQHSITPDALHVESHQQVLVFDVRQPLDLLADSEIIPGAKRIPPRDVLENPSLIPQDKDAFIYCSPADETTRNPIGSRHSPIECHKPACRTNHATHSQPINPVTFGWK